MDPRPLSHEQLRHRQRCAAYYDVLNTDPDWSEDQGRPRFSGALRVLQRRFSRARAVASGECAELQNRGEITAVDALEIPFDVAREVMRPDWDKFVNRWKLPRDRGAGDVFWAIAMIKDGLLRIAEFGSTTMTPLGVDCVVRPQPFAYDPSEPLEPQMRTVIEDAKRQADHIREQHLKSPLGWGRRGKTARFQLGARRFYQAKVCGWSFADINRREPGKPLHRTTQAISISVHKWAADFGYEPEAPFPGQQL